MAEQLIASAMVPGLVTVKKSDGTMQNLWPIDAKELLATGEAELVENGSIEAARLNANPLRSGRSTADLSKVVAEVTGPMPAVMVAADEKTADSVKKAGDNADAVGGETVTSQNKSTAPAEKPEVKKTDAKK